MWVKSRAGLLGAGHSTGALSLPQRAAKCNKMVDPRSPSRAQPRPNRETGLLPAIIRAPGLPRHPSRCTDRSQQSSRQESVHRRCHQVLPNVPKRVSGTLQWCVMGCGVLPRVVSTGLQACCSPGEGGGGGGVLQVLQ